MITFLLRCPLLILNTQLSDSRERQEACELLQECHESIILPLLGHSPLKIDVSGLEIMNDDPGNYN